MKSAKTIIALAALLVTLGAARSFAQEGLIIRGLENVAKVGTDVSETAAANLLLKEGVVSATANAGKSLMSSYGKEISGSVSKNSLAGEKVTVDKVKKAVRQTAAKPVPAAGGGAKKPPKPVVAAAGGSKQPPTVALPYDEIVKKFGSSADWNKWTKKIDSALAADVLKLIERDDWRAARAKVVKLALSRYGKTSEDALFKMSETWKKQVSEIDKFFGSYKDQNEIYNFRNPLGDIASPEYDWKYNPNWVKSGGYYDD